MKNIIIGTAGHIDHGKTTLIKYLTGKDTDTLPEEKKRGITIDLGFSFLDISENKKVGIIDVPGHEKFIKNMVAGISGINYIILVVALDDGVMPQTKEHFNIGKLLGIKHGVIVLTKKDLVDEEQNKKVREELKKLVKNSFLEDAKIFETSQKDKTSYEELKNFIIKDVENIQEKSEKNVDDEFKMYIDRVFSVNGFGTVVTGTVVQGEIKVDDFVNIYPLDKKVRVKGIENHGVKVSCIQEGQRCALNVSGIEKNEVKRGSVVSSNFELKHSHIIDVVFEPLKNIQIKNNQKIKVHIGTKEVNGKIRIFMNDLIFIKDEDEIKKDPAQIYLEEDMYLSYKEMGIVRDISKMETLGGITILNLSLEKIKKNNFEYAQKIMDIYNGYEKIETKYTTTYLKDILKDFHEKNHLKKGILKAELKNRYFNDLSNKDFKLFLNDNLEKDEIKIEVALEKEYVSLKEYKIKLTKDEKEIKEKIFKIYKESRFIPRKESIIEKDFSNIKNFRDIHEYLTVEGMIIFLEDDFYILKGFLKEAEKLVSEYISKNEKITLYEIRELLGVDRNSAIMISEKLDRLKITKRKEDYRVLY